MAFIVHNEGFICSYCGKKNPPAVRTCRNHCYTCLCSKHVDDASPGDRASMCNGKMVPIKVIPDSKKDWIILHECQKCGKQIHNKTAEDDDFEQLLKIGKSIS